MKVQVENLQGHFKKLSVEIPADIVSGKISQHFRDIQKDVVLKGFRKGKAPLQLVEQTYGESETPRITRQIISEYLNKALIDHKLQPVASPEIDVQGVAKSGFDLSFTATFENTPAVELKDYTGFKTSKKAVSIEESEVADTLKDLQNRMTRLEKADEGAALEEGKVIQADFEGVDGKGEKIAAASQENAFLEPGQGGLVPDFEKNILGLKKGETKNFTVKFPEKNPDGSPNTQTLSGKTVDFKITVKDVFTKVAPPIDDSFATQVAPVKDLEELKLRIREDLKNQKEQAQDRELQEKAIEYLIEKNPVQAPETLVNQQIQNLAIEAGMQLNQMGLPQDQIEERLKEWGTEMGTRAVTQVKASLLLGAIARQESIQVNDEDIRKELSRMATQTRRNPQDIVKEMQDQNMIAGFMRQIQELKALEWVVQKAVG